MTIIDNKVNGASTSVSTYTCGYDELGRRQNRTQSVTELSTTITSIDTFGSKLEIQNYLNSVYGVAVVEFEVTIFRDTFDWDSGGGFASGGSKNGSLDGDEDALIRTEWYDNNNVGFDRESFNYVVYVTREWLYSASKTGGFWIPTTFRTGHIQARKYSYYDGAAESNSTLHDLAHEIGHGQKISWFGSGGYSAHPFGHDPADLDPENLMNYTDVQKEMNEREKLRKSQWDEANPYLANDPSAN